MNTATDYKGDDCVVLPANYMDSVDAAVELYAEDLEKATDNLKVAGLSQSITQIAMRRGFTAGILWLMPVVWVVCV